MTRTAACPLASAFTLLLVSLAACLVSCGDDRGKKLPDAEIIYVPSDALPDTGGGQVDAPAVACEMVFLSPAAMAALGPGDDKDRDACANGFQYDIELAVAGGEGQTVMVSANGTPVGTAMVAGGRATVAGAQLGQGTVVLGAAIAGAAGCVASNTVTIDCNQPTCRITKPVLSDTHPKLNGRPVDEGGDRVSSPGSDYQVEFEVTTNIENGRPVVLRVSRPENPTQVTVINAMAMNGRATFPGVTLRPDGTFTIEAVCTNAAGIEGRSTRGEYTVDTVAPALTVTAPTEAQHYGPGDLTMGQFSVCATTTDTDAVGLSATRENMGRNLCAGIGTSSPTCVGVTMAGAGGQGCVALDCPGGAPFNVTVTLKDEAGNLTSQTVQAVTCASALPSVQIVTPTGDVAPYADVTARLLAATSTNAFKDADGSQAGAQTTVVACTDRQSAVARLLAGQEGGALAPIGAPVMVAAATAVDGCPNGLGFVARWTNVTVPESNEAADGSLLTATQLRVEVRDISTAVGMSPPVNFWVDSIGPSLQVSSTTPVCDTVIESASSVTRSVTLITSTRNVSLTVVGPTTQQTYMPTGYGTGTAIFSAVVFELGESSVTALATEPSGNTAPLLNNPCRIRVGQFPIVTFTAPPIGRNLCAAGNNLPTCVADASVAPGWQGTLTVSVTQAGVPANTGTVNFSANGVDLGTVNIVGGVATINVTIPDGAAVTLLAVTNDFAGTGSGQAARGGLIVDTVPPDAIATLAVAEEDRRASSFRLSWNAPADGTASVSSYDVRVATTAIPDETAFGAADAVVFGGSAAAPGQPESLVIGGRMIEQEQYFAVRAVDRVGNRGPIVQGGPIAARFRSIIISPPPTASPTGQFSFAIEGVSNLINDGDNVVRSEILVGQLLGQNAYIYRGTASPSDTNVPAVTISGPAGVGFGRSFVNIGNIDGLDGDGVARDDFAIGAPDDGNGKVYIFKGRASWNENYVYTDRDYEIDLGASYQGTVFGLSVARLGDVNGDGVADFAIGAGGFNSGQGRVIIVFGKQGFSTSNLDLAIIDGPAGTGARLFGSRITGMGRFYSGNGNSMVVAASGSRTVYSFGPLGPGSYSVTDARHTIVNSTTGNYATTLGFLGPIGGFPGVAIGAPSYSRAFFCSGTPMDGPFATCTRTLTSNSPTNFGRAMFSSAHPGTSLTDSILGDATWDAVVTSTAEAGGPGRVYIIDGTRVGTLPADADLATHSSVILNLPQGWGVTSAQRTGVVRDYDGDGYADIAIGETVPNQAGRIVLFY